MIIGSSFVEGALRQYIYFVVRFPAPGANMRFTWIGLGMVLLLAGCGSAESVEIADVNARNALNKSQSAYSRVEDLELKVHELETRIEELEQRLE